MNGNERMTEHQPRDNSAAERVRDISLRELLRSHGFEIKSEGITFRARNDRHNIVATGNLWFDNKAGVGGLGAIDLQMHLTGEDFRRRLSDTFHTISTSSSTFRGKLTGGSSTAAR
jgi:hypothetical protein